MLLFIVINLAVFYQVQCGFFDLTDVDDPLNLLFQNKDTLLGASKECTAPDGSSGVCQHRAQCLLTQGASYRNQACGKFFTCCITQGTTASTVTRTNARVSSFTSGNNPRSAQYIVTAASNNICQMRLDFLSFTLAPSTPIANADGTFRRICQTDSMTIQPNTYGIPDFCSTNSGQHVYVHLSNERQVTLTVTLGQDIATRLWSIRITQLECPGPQQLLTKHKFNNAENDFNLLAPIGAIQYFTNPTGTFSSFNANDEYLTGLNYAIAFKKTPTTPCIDFTATYFRMRVTASVAGLVEADCLDYLFVPGLTVTAPATTDGPFIAHLCSDVTRLYRFNSNTPGPLYVYFVSAVSTPTGTRNPVNYFNINYQLRSC